MSFASRWFSRAELNRAEKELGASITGDRTDLGEAAGAYGVNVLRQFPGQSREVEAALNAAIPVPRCWCGKPGRLRPGTELTCAEHSQ